MVECDGVIMNWIAHLVDNVASHSKGAIESKINSAVNSYVKGRLP